MFSILLCYNFINDSNVRPKHVVQSKTKYFSKLSCHWQIFYFLCIVKVKESRNRPDVAQRVPGGLGYQIFTTFGT